MRLLLLLLLIVLIRNLASLNSVQASIERKINQMLDVVSMAHDTGLQWLDGLLSSVSDEIADICLNRNVNSNL